MYCKVPIRFRVHDVYPEQSSAVANSLHISKLSLRVMHVVQSCVAGVACMVRNVRWLPSSVVCLITAACALCWWLQLASACQSSTQHLICSCSHVTECGFPWSQTKTQRRSTINTSVVVHVPCCSHHNSRNYIISASHVFLEFPC